MNPKYRCNRGKPKKDELLDLFVRSGGRCALCNKFLLDNQRSWTTGNFGEVAHIIACSNKGPRANPLMSRSERNSLSNLILLCPTDHKDVDDHEASYPEKLLLEVKKNHEDRIRQLTNLAGKPSTLLIRCQANIGGQIVRFSVNNFVWALEKHCPIDPQGLEIDFSSLSGDESPLALKQKAKEIDILLKDSLRPSMNRKIEHVSVFAIGPIPLLIQLGKSIGSSVGRELYHQRRGSQKWSWPRNGKSILFESKVISKPKKPNGVALVISISGLVRIDDIPIEIRKKKIVINICPKNGKPHLDLLTKPETIQNFISEYSKQKTMARANWGMIPIPILPAVPPAIAIAIGNQVLHKIDPKLEIYDYRKSEGGFRRVLVI